MLLILGLSPMISTAAMVQFDLFKGEQQSMQVSDAKMVCQDCTSEMMDKTCDSGVSSCGACVSGIYETFNHSDQPFHSIYSVAIKGRSFSYISTPDIKPPRT